MLDFHKHMINKDASVKEALRKLNDNPLQTLFVINEKKQLIGTLTDGDIRRGILDGNNLETPIHKYMFIDFKYIQGEIDVKKIKYFHNSFFVRLLPLLNENYEIINVFDLQRLKSILPLDAVIMAGGFGKRLRPLTDELPKPLLKLGNKTIIEYSIEKLVDYGIENIFISVHYQKEKIEKYLGNGNNWGVNIEYISEDVPLGTIGALSKIVSQKKAILITNSDLFTNIDYEDLYLNFIDKKADMAVASIPYTVEIPYAILRNNPKIEFNVLSFVEKPSQTYYANAGIYIIKKEITDRIPCHTFYNATDLLDDLLANNFNVIHNPIYGYWIDIGKPEDYAKAEEIVKHL